MFKRPPTEYEIIKQNNEKRNRKIFGTTMILFTIIVLINFILKFKDLDFINWLNGVSMGVIISYWFIRFRR